MLSSSSSAPTSLFTCSWYREEGILCRGPEDNELLAFVFKPSQHWQKGELQVRKMGENCSCFLLLLLIVVSIDLLLLQSRTRNVKGIT